MGPQSGEREPAVEERTGTKQIAITKPRSHQSGGKAWMEAEREIAETDLGEGLGDVGGWEHGRSGSTLWG